MADVLITHSYMLESDPKQFKLGQPYAPLGTLYAASVLKQAGIGICFYDCMFSGSTDQIIPVIQKEQPSILVIFDDAFSYLSKMCLSNMRENAFRLIQIGRRFGAMIVVCSADAVDNYALYLEKGADFVILGEGEYTLRELAARVLNNSGNDFADLRGIVWKQNGGLQVNKKRDLIENPDELPFPAWDLIDKEQYRKVWMKKNGYFSLNMVTTRGCPFQCIWCAKPVYGNNYNCRSPQNVFEELSYLKKEFSPDHIWFADDIFGLKPGWTEEFAELIKNNNTQLSFTIQSRVDLLIQKKQIQPLADAGCKKIWLGVESGSQKVLDAMQKGITVEQIYTSSELIREAGIEQAIFLQFGSPWENAEDIRKTIRLLTDLMPDDIGISITYPLPGTKLFELVKKEIRSKSHWKDSDDLTPISNSYFPEDFYKPLHRFVHKYYRYKQAIYYLSLFFKKKAKLNKILIRRIFLMPYYFIFSLFYRSILRIKGYATKGPV